VLLDEAVSPEQLDAVEADLHALVGTQLPRKRDVACDVLARGGTRGRLPGEQPHRLQLDRDVGDHERHRLPMGDRLAERLPLLDVGRDVVQDGLTDPDRQRTPGQAREPHALGVRRTVGVAEQVGGRHPDAVQGERGQGGGTDAHGGVRLDREPVQAGLDDHEYRPPVERRADHEQLGVRPPRHHRLHTVEHQLVTVAGRRRPRLERVEQWTRLGEGERRRRDASPGGGTGGGGGERR
jgi:hypothetical protein